MIASVFERRSTTNTDVPLCSHHSRFTDDTVLTVATAYAILDGHRIPIEVALPADCPVQGVAVADQVKCLDWRARHAQHAAVLPATVVAQVVARTRALLERPRGLLYSAVHGVSEAPEVRSVRRPVARAISNRLYRHISQTYCKWNVKFSQELAEDSPFRTWQWHVHARCDTAPERSTSSALMTCVSWGVINRSGCVDSPASFSTETVA